MAYSTIDKPSKYFNTILHTGNNTTPFSFTGVGFQPDFIWGKGRNNTFSHALFDSVRGVNKYLSSNGTGAEITNPTSGYLSSFNSDGFTAVAGTSNFANFNDNTINTPSTYVFWNWLANGAGVSNTQGSISSTVSANTTSGFSIVSYTGNGTSGATIGHGLGAVPKMIIVKNRNGTNQWLVYHASLGATKYLILETTGGAGTASTLWNDTTPTTSLFTVGNSSSVNGSTLTYIAYCFAEVKGFSKFGSYTGNGSTDGTFIYTGFKPAFVMVKASSTTGQWAMCDTKRGVAPSGEFLFAEDSGATNSAPANWDFVSNGFKARANYAAHNTSGVTHIYMAFAENPFVSSKGIPTTAR